MKALVIGSGGREHALAQALFSSPTCSFIYAAPGNPGTESLGENLAIAPADHEALAQAVRTKGIDMVIIGPEAPLAAGLADRLRQEQTLVIGPDQAAAQLESSKAFAKAFMQEQGIPTADYGAFSKKELKKAKQFAKKLTPPIVVKASGLASGKGVIMCRSYEEAEQTLEQLLKENSLGAAGETVVIEECLDGRELSVFALCNGEQYLMLPSAVDYKRIGEGDTGANTGGMGAVAPAPFADEALLDQVRSQILAPTLKGMQARGTPLQGFLYLGLMLVDGQPYVLEYNVRLGDPEAQAILPLIRNDFYNLMEACAQGTLDQETISLLPGYAVTVVCASEGYPGSYQKGEQIWGLEENHEALLTQAGTRRLEDGSLVTAGGRVVALTALADMVAHARERALVAAENVDFRGRYYRSDIGKDLEEVTT
jgi:phosphoribosylamine--glycine ligase